MIAPVNLNIGRLCLVAVVLCFNSVSACGHDLPQEQSLAHQAAMTCFSACMDETETYASLAHGIQSENRSQSVPCNSHLPIAAPANGVAPRPRLLRASPHSLALAQILKQIDDAQCQFSQALACKADLQLLIANQTQWLTDLVYASFAKMGPAQTTVPSAMVARCAVSEDVITTATTLPSTTTQTLGPQFVVFETLTGGHILLTVAQAQQWQFTVPTEQIIATKASAVDLLGTCLAPLQEQAVAAVSDSLELAANTLHGFSRSIARLAPIHVAKTTGGQRWQ